MNKFEQIEKCLSNIVKCTKFWVGYYFFAMLCITYNLISAMVENNMGEVIFYLIFFLITGIILLMDINEHFWTKKDTGKPE